MDVATHPNPQPNPHHRKIDLQSPADLIYLQRNLSAAATSKLNLHFPPKHAYATHIPLDGAVAAPQKTANETATQQDPLRARVAELVDDFLRQTWAGAKHGIRVNGMDASGMADHFSPAPSSSTPTGGDASDQHKTELEGVDFTYEAYDPALSAQLAALYADVECLNSGVSRLRRTNPRAGAEAYVAALAGAMDSDEQVYSEEAQQQQHRRTQIESASSESSESDEKEELLKIQTLPADVPQLYEQGLAALAGLSGLQTHANVNGAGSGSEGGNKKQASLTETVGKVQRARRVVGELE